MKDRHGNSIRVGFSEKEEIWIKAAMSLPIGERGEAYADIASMTGRKIEAIHSKVQWLRQKMAEESARLALERSRRVMVPARSNAVPQRAPGTPFIRQPTKQQMMAGRAR